jgi:hypothetical protein
MMDLIKECTALSTRTRNALLYHGLRTLDELHEAGPDKDARHHAYRNP